MLPWVSTCTKSVVDAAYAAWSSLDGGPGRVCVELMRFIAMGLPLVLLYAAGLVQWDTMYELAVPSGTKSICVGPESFLANEGRLTAWPAVAGNAEPERAVNSCAGGWKYESGLVMLYSNPQWMTNMLAEPAGVPGAPK